MKKLIVFVFAITLSQVLKTQNITAKQKDTSVKQVSFLWFKGYWKSKNVFVTMPFTDSSEGGMSSTIGGGSTVTVANDGQVHLSSQNTDEWNKKIENGLNNLQKFQDEINDPANTINEWGNHFSQVVEPELNNLKQYWQAEKIDVKNDVLNPDSKEQQEANALQKFMAGFNTWCIETQPKYDAIISFYKAHKKEKDADLQNPAPPEFDYQCIACDTSLEKQHEKQTDDYDEKFFKPESDLLQDALKIERVLMLIGYGTDFTGTDAERARGDMGEQIANAFSKRQNGACSYMESTYELNEAIRFLVGRMYHRAKKLLHDYRKNIKTSPTVITTLIRAGRSAILMGMGIDEDGDLAECSALVSRVLGYYSEKLFHEHDWSQLANIPFLLSLERSHQLLGGTESQLLGDLHKLLTGFRLQIEMDVKLGKDNTYILAHLKGDEKIAPEFEYVNDTCYRWVLVEGFDLMGFPKKKTSQQIECDLLANEIVAPGPHPVYAGTKKYSTMLYGLKMDFCHPGQDSIFLSGFVPMPNAMAGKWQIPLSPPQPLQINGTDNVFRNLNKMEEMANSGQAQKDADQMKAEGEKLIAQMKSLQQQMESGRNLSNPATMQKMQDLATKVSSLGVSTGLSPILYIDFPLEIKNNETTLHDKRFDAKEINPREAPVIIYAYYTVKVIYKPDNSSKPSLK